MIKIEQPAGAGKYAPCATRTGTRASFAPRWITRTGWRQTLAAAAIAFGFAHAAQATVVFNNGAPDQGFGTNMSANVVAEDFSLGIATNVTSIRFWSIQSAAGDYLGNLSWSIYSNSGAQPGAVVTSGLFTGAGVATGASTAFGYSEFVFDIPTSFALAAGDYWLGLANTPLNPVNPTEMLWETTAGGLGSNGLYLDGANWIDSLNDHAFLINSTPVVVGVPEPGTLALLMITLAAAGIARRKA